MNYNFESENLSLNIVIDKARGYISSGRVGEISLLSSPLFKAEIKNLTTGEKQILSSLNEWENIKVEKKNSKTIFNFTSDDNLTFIVTLENKNDRLEWQVEVINNSSTLSVMGVNFPTPIVTGDNFSCLIPSQSGMLIEDGKNAFYNYKAVYPSANCTMQFTAIYSLNGGIYIGAEDGEANIKEFNVSLKNGECEVGVYYYGIGASLPKNSFELCGKCVWQFFEGDWYDACALYSNFVSKNATWLPEIDFNGRIDTAKRYKDIAFWVSDYMPNSASQGDNKPKNLSAGSDIYEKDYWHTAPLLLREKLGVPIAYHVYNWHEIPFNIEYPHFLPAKKEFIENAEKLRRKGIYIFPYINAMAWEKFDGEMGHKINFENTGSKCTAVNEDGSFVIEEYPQKTVSGKSCQLTIACGSSKIWQEYIYNLTKEMENTLDIDGVYYDEVGATNARVCYNKQHSHTVGGGSFWVKGYNKMMKNIRENRNNDNFYFTEGNAEPYMKSFDGFLTWEWVDGCEVPAFSAVYNGYVQLIGRCTMGTKKDDFEFFKYCTAKSFIYGQQLGWSKADIVYNEKYLEFLKGVVKTRYAYSDIFNCSSLLRPPKVKTNLSKFTSLPGLWFENQIVCDYILASAFKNRKTGKVTIFAFNFAENNADFELIFNAKEYNISPALMKDCKIEGENCTICGSLEKYQIKVWQFDEIK